MAAIGRRASEVKVEDAVAGKGLLSLQPNKVAIICHSLSKMKNWLL